MQRGHVKAHSDGVSGDGTASAPGLHAGGSRRELLLGLLLFVVVFAFHLVLETKLRAMGAFACFNTLFDADPGLTLEAICCGGGSNHVSHPMLEYFFSLPIGVIAKVGSLLTSGGLGEVLVRRWLGLAIVPVAAGLQTFVLLHLLRWLGLSLRSAFLLALLSSVSFSKIIFGSMPESYCLTALSILFAYVLFVLTRGRRGMRVELTWIALGVLSAGITVTNIVPVAILYFLREGQLGRGVWGRCVRTAVMAALALVVTLGGGFGLDWLLDAQPGNTPNEAVWISRYFVEDPAIQLTTFPTAVINGIAPPVPGRKPNRFAWKAEFAAENAARKAVKAAGSRRPAPLPGVSGPATATESDARDRPRTQLVVPDQVARSQRDPVLQDARNGDTARGAAADTPASENAGSNEDAVLSRPIPIKLTLQPTHQPRSIRNLIGIAFLATLAWVALKDKRLDPTFRSLARASLVVLAFNWILHGFWGGEQFLYSQHWHVSLLVLMGAAVSVLEARRWNAVAPLIICVVGIAVSNSLVLVKTLQALLGD